MKKEATQNSDVAMLDISANRGASKWSKRELVGRLFWAVVQPLFYLSPRPLWGVRNSLLRLFGARIGSHVHFFPTAKVTIPWNLAVGDHCAIGDGAILYALGPIRLGNRVTISQRAHLCAGTHDFESPTMELLKPPIEIGDDVWVCADAFIGPDINVGDRAVVGARAVITKDVPADTIVAGNPANQIGTRNIKAANTD